MNSFAIARGQGFAEGVCTGPSLRERPELKVSMPQQDREIARHGASAVVMVQATTEADAETEKKDEKSDRKEK